MRPEWEPLLGWLGKYRGRAFGAGLGLLVGLIVLIVGFWRGLFLAACVYVGWFLGSRIDGHESLSDLINRLLPPGD